MAAARARGRTILTAAEGICRDFVQDACSNKSCKLTHLPADLKYYDTHCHLDRLLTRFRVRYEDFGLPKNFAGTISNFIDPENYKMIDDILDNDKVWGTVGIHPQHAGQLTPKLKKQVEKLHENPKILAVGETGLDDKHLRTTSFDDQMEAYKFQLELAEKLDKPVVFHCRDAHDDMFYMAKQFLQHTRRIHLHCFTGNTNQAMEWIDQFPNLKIGITNLVSANSVKALQEAVTKIPLENLLIETDAPYMLPRNLGQIYRQKFSHPGLALNVASVIATLKEKDVLEVIETTTANAKFVYGL